MPTTKELIDQFPFWGPANAGPAKNFAAPYYVVGQQLADDIKDRKAGENTIPQEVKYNNNQVLILQVVPAYVPRPQSPVQVQDQYSTSSSLLDYAKQTLGGAGTTQSDNRGA